MVTVCYTALASLRVFTAVPFIAIPVYSIHVHHKSVSFTSDTIQ